MVAIRFGGYPEQVRGMSDAMYGGIAVEAEIEQHRVIISTQKSNAAGSCHTTVCMQKLCL